MPEGNRPDARQVATSVIDLLEPELAAAGFDLLDVRVFQGGGRDQVRVYVDTLDGGISLGECTRAARTVGMLLEEADLFPGKYIIEVSSPGVRRPLRKPEHFEAVIGQKVDLKPASGGKSGRIQGILRGVESSVLSVEIAAPEAEGSEPEIVTVPLARLREANLDPEFDVQALINADRRRRKEDKRTRRREKSSKGSGRSRPRKGKSKDPESSGDSGDG